MMKNIQKTSNKRELAGTQRPEKKRRRRKPKTQKTKTNDKNKQTKKQRNTVRSSRYNINWTHISLKRQVVPIVTSPYPPLYPSQSNFSTNKSKTQLRKRTLLTKTSLETLNNCTTWSDSFLYITHQSRNRIKYHSGFSRESRGTG